MASPQNRIVHYVLANGDCRPLLVTRAWSDTMVNGTLFIDGTSDYNAAGLNVMSTNEAAVLTVWKTSIGYKDNTDNSITSNTWHWPERD